MQKKKRKKTHKALSLIPNINLVFLRGQPPIKRAPTAAVNTCESRPSHFIIIWSVEKGPLGGFLLSPCHCYNKVETGARPLGYGWWQVGPSDSAGTYNAPSHSEGPRGEHWGSLRLKKLGCACLSLKNVQANVSLPLRKSQFQMCVEKPHMWTTTCKWTFYRRNVYFHSWIKIYTRKLKLGCESNRNMH